jgi:hypothetical protein
MSELERTISEFVQAHHESQDLPIPPSDGARALLRARMAELAAAPAPSSWRQFVPFRGNWRTIALACSSLMLTALGAFLLYPNRPKAVTVMSPESRSIPDPKLTPGYILTISREDVCADGMAEAVRLVPESVALQVFASYGIDQPEPGAYELDYLITPALGGADHVRNFWPQPYRDNVWNAHIKDALEDHLYRLVCAGKLELATAQRDMARDWIAAYRKYFRTEDPLSQHASFLKDRPWE